MPRAGSEPGEVAATQLARAAALLRGRLADTAIEIGPPAGLEGDPACFVIADQRRQLADEEVRQTWSGRTVAVGLAEHQADVAARARGIAVRLALGERTAQAPFEAGALHDEGKRDPVLIRYLCPAGRRCSAGREV